MVIDHRDPETVESTSAEASGAPSERHDAGFRALGDETRRSIIALLSHGSLTASAIGAAFPVSQPAISRHLRVLRESGLVAERRVAADGRVRQYALRPDALQPLVDWLLGIHERPDRVAPGPPVPVEGVPPSAPHVTFGRGSGHPSGFAGPAPAGGEFTPGAADPSGETATRIPVKGSDRCAPPASGGPHVANATNASNAPDALLTPDREALPDVSPPPAPTPGPAQIVVFGVGGVSFGVDVARVHEIVRSPAVTPVPLAPPLVRGVADIRGRLVPVLDLRARLGVAAETGTGEAARTEGQMVVVEAGGDLVALEVDEVTDVPRIASDRVEAPPARVIGANAGFLDGVVRIDGSIVFLVDPEGLVLDEPSLAGRPSPGPGEHRCL